MFNWLRSLFGTQKNMDKVVETASNGIYNGLDKLIYTEEEKADAMAKGRELFVDFVKIAYEENSIRSIARRWLAFMVIAPEMFLFLMSGVIYPFDATYAGHLLTLVQIMAPWSAGILAFYFGPHLLSALKKD